MALFDLLSRCLLFPACLGKMDASQLPTITVQNQLRADSISNLLFLQSGVGIMNIRSEGNKKTEKEKSEGG